MTSFPSKICRRRERKRENDNYCSDPFLPDPLLKIPKKSNKIHKSNKYPYGFISSQNKLVKAEKERK